MPCGHTVLSQTFRIFLDSHMIQLIVGLGNPGPEYEETRHNAGFWWIDEACDAWNIRLQPEKSFFAHVGRGTVQGHQIWLMKPQTFMNRSGLAVGALCRFYKIPADHVLVVHDELDLSPGQIKLKHGGGHAGHNGLRDIHAQLGTPDYWRLRIGIGHPGVKSEVVHWVLRKPPLDDRIAVDQAISHSFKGIPDLIAGENDKATKIIHTRD